MRLQPKTDYGGHSERLFKAPWPLTGDIVDQLQANAVLQGPQRHTCLVGGARAGKTKRQVTAPELDEAYAKQLSAKIENRLKDALNTQKYPKFES